MRADAQRPVVHLEVAYTIQDAQGPHRKVFIGYVALRAQQGSWVIEGNSYTSAPPHPPASSRQITSPPVDGAPEPAPQFPVQPVLQGVGLTVGSQEILTRLWPAQQLRSDPQEESNRFGTCRFPITPLQRGCTLGHGPRSRRQHCTPPSAESNSRRTTKWSA